MGATMFKVVAGLVVALLVTVVILMRIQSGDTLLLTDPAHPVAPLVRVQGSQPAKGGGELFYVDVQEEPASEFDKLFPWIHPHSTLVPTKELVPPGTTNAEYERIGLLEMKFSKQIASIVAERRLGLNVVLATLVVKVEPQSHARGILKPEDAILAVNGTPTPTPGQLKTVMAKVKPGAVVALRVLRGQKTQTVSVKTSERDGKAIIGIEVAPVPKLVKLPVRVTINSGNIGGPSAGLAFTLEVLQRLGVNVTHGYKVAATGEMNLDGKVTAIGGVEQKTWGARDAGAQIFLVPVDGGNAKMAEKFAGSNLKIIPVTSIGQALKALAALPKLK
jgi:PDZ domain-containing protein